MFQTIFRTFVDKRSLIVFFLGFTSGFPWAIIGSSMTVWLKENDLSRTAIGFFGSIFAIYSINFLWSPLVDRVRLPYLGAMGQRKSWVVLCQIGIILGMSLLGLTDPSVSVVLTSLLALSIALSSATQDIAIDAFRIEIIRVDESRKIAAAAALATAGWWTGFKLPAALALYMSDFPAFNWSDIFVVLCIIPICSILIVSLLSEPDSTRNQYLRNLDAHHTSQLVKRGLSAHFATYVAWIYTSVVSPLQEFFSRGKSIAVSILLFVIFFKVGEAFLGKMAKVFYIELGFTNSEIATYSSVLGWVATVVFSLIGAVINIRYGVIKGLFVSGCAMAASNLMFALMAWVGEPNPMLFAATIIVDDFTSAVSTVSFVAFISYLCNRAFTATQYALLASLATFGRTSLSATSGAAVDFLDGNWALFFCLTALAVIPSLILLLWLGNRVGQVQPAVQGQSAER